MNVLLPLPVVLPLLGAAVLLALHPRSRLSRLVSIVVTTANLIVAVVLLIAAARSGMLVVDVGGWPAPIGITLVVDVFSGLMLAISTSMVLAVLVYAIGSPRTHDAAEFFHPVYLTLAAGLSACFITGDLFNLFVAFEVMLTSSYVLITLGGTKEQIRAGMTYVVISLLSSLLFITAIALIYAATGTVNLADLAGRLDQLPTGLRSALGTLLLLVFGIKAAIFPLFFWLPDSYPTAPTAVTAVFAGLLTKVGVYAIIRTQTLLFATEGPSSLLLSLAALTMLVGVLGAIAQNEVKRILSFHIISQIGYMIFGLGLFTVAGLAAAIFYIVHHIVVKTSLFLVEGLLEDVTGTSALKKMGGVMHVSPAVAALFAVPALSLAGLPPFSGFVAKLGLVQAGIQTEAMLVVAVSLVVSLLTMFSMNKIWAGVFWGSIKPKRLRSGRAITSPLMTSATAALVVLSLGIGVGAGPLFDLSTQAAQAMLDPSTYAEAVLDR